MVWHVQRVEFSKWKVNALKVEQLMLRKCISAVLWQNPIIQSSMHQIFPNMYSTGSIGPSFKENLTGFSHTPHTTPSNGASPYFTVEPLPSVSLPIIASLQPSKKLTSKFITPLLGNDPGPPHSKFYLLSISYWSACYSLNLKHYITIIKSLWWKLTLHFPKAIQHKLIYSSTTKTI